jgi:peptide/nickel transport system ATP-binding protein
MNILKVENLTLKTKDKTLLDSINFEIREGEIFALVGESGSGKSLTSLAIMRLLPDNIKITNGDISLRDSSLFKMPEFQMQKVRGKSIAMIFQEPMSALNPVMSIGEQVAEVIELHLRLGEDKVKDKVVSLFKEVGIKEPRERYSWFPHQLSGGQKQRVMIAMALACEPDLLIADEPTTALDVTIQAKILQLLKDIQQERGLSILFITHDMGVVAQMADRIAVMRYGEIVEENSRSNFFNNPQHPYTKQLLHDVMVYERRAERVKSQKILNVKDLKVHFPIKKGILKKTVGYVRAVNSVNFSISRGKTLALVGESGSGKSTIGGAILKLLDITDGTIFFNGVNIDSLTPKELMLYRQDVQIIFQDPYSSLNPRMSIGEIIREGMVSLRVGSRDKKVQNRVIEELLLKVGLEREHFYRYPHEFSGGQRQRIGIARALAVKPKLIICDEPTSALDVSVRSQVLKLLKRLQKEEELSYLFITHDLSIVPIIADEVAVMKSGRIVERGLVEDVMENPQKTYTKKLLNSAPKLELELEL